MPTPNAPRAPKTPAATGHPVASSSASAGLRAQAARAIEQAVGETLAWGVAVSSVAGVLAFGFLHSELADAAWALRDPAVWVERAAFGTLLMCGAIWAVWRTRGQALVVPFAVLVAGLRWLARGRRTERLQASPPPPQPAADDAAPLGEGLPPLALLAPDQFLAERRRVAEDPALAARAERIRRVLEMLKVPVAGAGAPVVGPAVTRFEFRVGTAVPAARVERVGRDVGAALGMMDVRVIYPVPGKPETVGIEVENRRVATVYLRGLLAELRGRECPPLTVALGRGLDGRPVFHDLAAMPHLLIGGATGAGKSVLLHALLCSLICRQPPERLWLVFVDPKQVELAPYRPLPHARSFVWKREEAALVLRWAVEITNERYALLEAAGARNIARYNTLPGVEPLPYVVVVIDETAELMLGDRKLRESIEQSIQSLSQKARAAGVHLVLATQRPSVDVIGGVIKANIPSRLALKTASSTDSGVILDQPGAETLIGRGDMLFLPVGHRAPERVQAPLVTEEEVAALVAWWRSRRPASIQAETVAPAIGDGQHAGSGADADGAPDGIKAEEEAPDDPLFTEAARWLAGQETVSVRSLRGAMGIGTHRAAALLDLFAEMGWVGQAQGARPRPVLLSREERADVGRGAPLPGRGRSVAGEPKSVTGTGEKALPETLPEADAFIEEPRAVTPTEGDHHAVCLRCRQVVARVPRGMAARIRCPECGEEVMVGGGGI